MTDEKIELISAYEVEHRIPEINRYTELVGSINVLKPGISPDFVNKRYEEAFAEKKEQQELDPDTILILEITLDHNLKDIARYSVNNIDKLLKDFYFSDKAARRIGIKKRDSDTVFLLELRKGVEYPELVNMNLDSHLEGIRYEWIKKLFEIKNEDLITETKQLLARADSPYSSKQSPFDFEKAIKKKMQTKDKIFLNERMEGYDFRSVDLEDGLFVNCYLQKANFSGCNMQNVLFINCDIDEAIFLGAMTNNCYMLNSPLVSVTDKLKEWTL